MIPMLLWRCPFCHKDDALSYKRLWLRDGELACAECGTVWTVQRVIGSDFLLTVRRGEPSVEGMTKPLAAWYDLMKSSFKLMPKEDPPMPLSFGEEFYLRARRSELWVEQDSPLLQQWEKEEPPCERAGALGLSFMSPWDRGQFSLTSERGLWEGQRGSLLFWLTKVNAAYAEKHRFLCLQYGIRIYKIRFEEESVLKWLSYIALVAERIERIHQHRISLSNY
jgi:hypothetical protein